MSHPISHAVRRMDAWTPEVAAVVRAVIDAAEQHDGSSPVDEALHLMLRHEGLDRAELWLAGEDGFALAHRTPDDADSTHHLDLVVAPDARRRGLGGDLAVAALASRPGPWAAWSHGDHPAAAKLAAEHGFAATRSLWVMRLAAGRDVPHRDAPAEVTLRSFAPGDVDGVLAVNAAAFADHPEQGSLDRAGFDQRAAESWFDSDGLIVAARDGEVVGFHWTKTHDGPSPHGEVYVIGVAPQLQGSGLGAALLSAGVAHLRSRGLGEVVLYVESDNPAVRLYERVGFTHAATDTHVQYTRG